MLSLELWSMDCNLRLIFQLFKTRNKGWGLRTLDDIPVGAFICLYAGEVLTNDGADETGRQFGDEYLAELDYIEIMEERKLGIDGRSDMDDE